MEDMLSFITRNIRAMGFTVDDFVDKIDISRQKFYRFIKEPERFDNDTLDKISVLLNFSSQQRKQLFAYQNPEIAGNAITEGLIRDILLCDSPIQEDNEFLEFEYYDKDSIGAHKWAASTMAKRIIDSMTIKTKLNEHVSTNSNDVINTDLNASPINDGICICHHNFTITIYNCLSKESLASLARLFYAFEKQIKYPDTIHIRVSHFIPDNHLNIEDQLELLKTIMPLLSVSGDYTCRPDTLQHPIWTNNSNFCIIKYSNLCVKNGKDVDDTRKEKNKVQEYMYYLLNVSERGKSYVSAIYDEYLYRFFTLDTRGLIQGYARKGNALDINMRFYQLCSTYQKILIHYDFCFDNIPCKMWESVFTNFSSDSYWLKKSIATILDPEKCYADLSEDQIIENGIVYLGERYKANEEMGAINILFASGLREFATKGMISDLSVLVPDANNIEKNIDLRDKVHFDPNAVREFLTSICEGIKNRSNRPDFSKDQTQQYYIVKPFLGTRERDHKSNSYVIFKDSSLYATAFDSHHKNDSITFYDDKEVINTIFSYITDTLIANRGAIDSIIMKDDDAIEYLTRIIEEVPSSYDA